MPPTPFYARLNEILDQYDFDGFVEGLCERFHAARSLPVASKPVAQIGERKMAFTTGRPATDPSPQPHPWWQS